MTLPYDPEDHALAAAMNFDREAGNGDRYYLYPVRGHETAAQFARTTEQAYFYRAMLRAEAMGWLRVANTVFTDRQQVYEATPSLLVDGHGGWASYRDYSLGYLKPKPKPKVGYTHLLEIHAPDFLQWLSEIGVLAGKVEVGDMSWGVGATTSNGFNGNKDTNKALKALYGKVKNNGVEIDPSRVKGRERAMANAVTPYIFCQSIRHARVVALRSAKP